MIQTTEVIFSSLTPKMYTYPTLLRTIGQVSIMVQYGELYSRLLIAVNRYVTICKPPIGWRYFSTQKTLHYLTAIWVLSLTQSFVYQLSNFFF